MPVHPEDLPKRPSPVYPRRRCDNCPKFFLQTKPWKRFCSSTCRRQFHDNKTAYGKLKEILTKHISREVNRLVNEHTEHILRTFVTRNEILGDEGAALVRRAVERARARNHDQEKV